MRSLTAWEFDKHFLHRDARRVSPSHPDLERSPFHQLPPTDTPPTLRLSMNFCNRLSIRTAYRLTLYMSSIFRFFYLFHPSLPKLSSVLLDVTVVNIEDLKPE